MSRPQRGGRKKRGDGYTRVPHSIWDDEEREFGLVEFLAYFASHSEKWVHKREVTCGVLRIGLGKYEKLRKAAVAGGYLELNDYKPYGKVLGQTASVNWRPDPKLIEVEAGASACRKPVRRTGAPNIENLHSENRHALKEEHSEEGAEERAVEHVEPVEAETWHRQTVVALEPELQDRCIEEVKPSPAHFSLSDWQCEADDVTDPDAWK